MDLLKALSSFEVEFQKFLAYPANNHLMNEATKRFIKSKKLPSILQVSQNVSEESCKTRGQDVASASFHKGYHVLVVCDGHDDDGLFVATEIAVILPKLLFKVLEEEKKEEITQKMIFDAFILAEIHACFAKSLKPSEGDKCFLPAEKMEDFKFCQLVEFKDEERTECVLKVLNTTLRDEKKEEMIEAKLEDLWGSKYYGGCTCSCVIFKEKTRDLCVASLGDSRVVILPPVESKLNRNSLIKFEKKKDEFGVLMQPVRPTNPFEDEQSYFPSDESKQNSTDTYGTLIDSQTLLFSTAHQLQNASETERIQKAFKGQHLMRTDSDGCRYLCHPETEVTIEPTRGFGDVEMLGTGYTFVPQISERVVVPKGTLLCMGSDGIFDAEIWSDGELAFFMGKLREESGFEESDEALCLNKARRSLKSFAQDLFSETVTRATQIYDTTQVDDISIICSIVL